MLPLRRAGGAEVAKQAEGPYQTLEGRGVMEKDPLEGGPKPQLNGRPGGETTQRRGHVLPTEGTGMEMEGPGAYFRAEVTGISAAPAKGATAEEGSAGREMSMAMDEVQLEEVGIMDPFKFLAAAVGSYSYPL